MSVRVYVCLSVCLCLSVSMCMSVCISVSVSDWSTDEVCSWLRDLDLEEYCSAFTAHDIRGRELLTLGRADLKVEQQPHN